MAKNTRANRRKLGKAQRNVEDLATKCLSSAVSAVMLDSGGVYTEEDVQWQRAGTVAVEMAVQIRLHSSKRIEQLFNTQEGRLDLDRLATDINTEVAN